MRSLATRSDKLEPDFAPHDGGGSAQGSKRHTVGLRVEEPVDDALLARQLSGLGYPGFAHLRPRKANPAAVILAALLQKDLETRLTEALPWVLLTYSDLDWSWLIRHAKLQDVQNRLGFLIGVGKGLTADGAEYQSAFNQLCLAEQQLERARLARQDTLCRESMPTPERH